MLNFAQLGVCVAVGFFAVRVLFPASLVAPTQTGHAASLGESLASEVITASPRQESLVAEWEEVRRMHENTAAAFPALYAFVTEIKDSFRRRAFRAALYADWAATDPQGAIAFFVEKHPWSAGQVLREWMRLDPERAITQMLAGGEKNVGMLVDAIEEVVRVAPGRLAEVASKSPGRVGAGGTGAESAFALFAKRDPEAAMIAAESVIGPMRAGALAGVGKTWAETDAPAALGWAEAMPKGEARDAAMRAVFVGWAKNDPLAALAKIDLAPAARRDSWSDVGAHVLEAAAKNDWEGTLRWLRDNPGKLGQASLNGLNEALSPRLKADPLGALQSLQKSGLPTFSNGFYDVDTATYDAIWKWVDDQPVNSFTGSVRGALVTAMAQKDPDAALALLESIPDSPENRELLAHGAQSFLNGGSQNRLEELIAKASSKMRPFLIEAGFPSAFGDRGGSDLQKWIGRLNELPAERRVDAAGTLARNWATNDPEGATQWAFSLQEPQQRSQAIGSAVGAWSATDGREAAEWIDSLPTGADRDIAAVSLIGTVGRSEPETAWTWALSVQTPQQRQQALQAAFVLLHKKNPALAREIVRGADMPAAESAALLERFGL